jgi:hypothetical protein
MLSASLAFAACAPTPPFATLETAETLHTGQVSATAYGGAGGGSGGVCCGGGGARVRYGLDDRQEIGIDAEVLDDGSNADFGAKLAYKRRIAQSLAIVAGAGGTSSGGNNSAYGNTLGGDFGLIASTLGPRVQVYGSVRVTAAGRLGSRDPRASEAALAAVGIALPLGPLRLLGELGGIAAIQQAHSRFDDVSTPIVTSDAEGFYFAGGLAYTWR